MLTAKAGMSKPICVGDALTLLYAVFGAVLVQFLAIDCVAIASPPLAAHWLLLSFAQVAEKRWWR